MITIGRGRPTSPPLRNTKEVKFARPRDGSRAIKATSIRNQSRAPEHFKSSCDRRAYASASVVRYQQHSFETERIRYLRAGSLFVAALAPSPHRGPGYPGGLLLHPCKVRTLSSDVRNHQEGRAS
jgi:hypothetical protein